MARVNAHAVRLLTDALHQATATRVDRHLSYSFDVEWSGSRSRATWNPSDTSARDSMIERLVRLRSGSSTLEDVRSLGRAVGGLLLPQGTSTLASLLPTALTGESDIELLFEESAQRLATDLPWEMVPVDATAAAANVRDVVAQSLAAKPIVRVVDGLGNKANTGRSRGRLRALLCIAEPEIPMTGVAASAWNEVFDPIPIERIRDALTRAFRPFRAFDTRWLPHRPDEVTAHNLEAMIRATQPHVFLLVAHGSSGNETGSPAVRLSDAWCPVKRLARCMCETDQPVLAVWICCDQVQTPHGGGQSAALAAIEAGVSEVVSMQGNIAVPEAERFVRSFLEHLLAGMSTAIAARQGRVEVSNRLHAFLPTVFRSAKWLGEGSVVSRKAEAYRTGLLRLRGQFPRQAVHLRRPSLENKIRERLAENGLLVITGGPGVGKTQLTTAAARRMLPTTGILPRPVIRVDISQLPRPTGDLARILQALRQRLEEHGDLLPENLASGAGDGSASAVLSYVNDCRIVVILDHIPAWPLEGVRDVWRDFVATAQGLDQSLIVAVVTEGWLSRVANAAEVLVKSFSPEETKDYVDRYIRDLAPQWRDLHMWTGGRPAWLDLVRRRIQEGYPASDFAAILDSEHSKVADFMLDSLDDNDRVAAHCLARLRHPSSRRLATEFLIPGIGPKAAASVPRESVSRLLRLGLLVQWTDRRAKFIRMPELLRARATLLEPPCESFAGTLCEHFLDRVGVDPARTIARIYAEPGGPPVLSAIQSAFIETANERSALGESAESTRAWTLALAIATYADSGTGVTHELLELYRPLTSDAVPDPLRTRAMLRGQTVARSIGEVALAEEWLGRLEHSEMAPAERAEFLFTQARFLKDVEQHAAAARIHEAISSGLVAARESSEDTKWLQIELLQVRIDARMFLEGALPEDVADDFKQIEDLRPTPEQLGNALATFAERAQRNAANGDAGQWNTVGDYALRAYRLVAMSQDHRFRGFAAYRYARYLEEGTQQYADAACAYAEAEEEAQLAGEPRRQACAGFRRLRLQWEVLREVSGRTASDQADDLLHLVNRQAIRDSFTLRVAQRLLLLRAEMAERDGTGPFLELLKSACRTGAALPPGSQSDDRCLGVSLCRSLKWMRAIGAFAEAQLMVHELGEALRSRLNVETTGHNPWQVEAQLARRYNS